ncbi:glycosyltransferase family 1 protein [Clostridium ljungdahlii]|uniref:Mannosylfructose-phosphate synthase n=1 Tax=Clostridium ljungdahlii (strain ATCC 55383 / DSM 13528 / PETC) TaxID=748727 RepID=D8GMJ5_CLOLD|nr:glycosyltransferase family 1 protein [Clostridium ljungdahlii]ADK13605.1 predicted glycosyltransferase [Clostridium ljungdahlii DSM 13528]OAA89222.1 Mannosylfructose-phosphate synthase [Clostridium ljungdahlii DSM 13528]
MSQVVFNALQTSLSGGIGRYCYEVSKAIYKQHKIDFKIVIREEDKGLFSFADIEDLIIVEGIKNAKQRNFYEQFKLPKLIYKKYPDAIIHYPDTMAPIFAKNKVIITVHDLAFKSLKDAFTWKTTLWKNFITDLSIKKAHKIIAITEFAKNEILKYYPMVNDKISVVYNGFNNFSKEPIDVSNINQKILDLKNGKYILTVSTISPRKNIDGLIKAFGLIKDKICDYKLVIAGKNGWLYENVYKVVSNLGLNDRIIFTGSINDDELKFLYKNASLFVYPSFYEGFGLPPLEAMSYGIPCVVSNRTSIPEVVGDAAIKVNPDNLNELGNKIFKVISNGKLCDFLRANSNKRLECFSWKKSGQDTIKVYYHL